MSAHVTSQKDDKVPTSAFVDHRFINSSSMDDVRRSSSFTDLDDAKFMSYWKLLGKIVGLFCIPLIAFTVIFALKWDHIVDWNYWIVFSPVLGLLLLSLLLSASQKLSGPAPTQIRVTWLLWLVSVTTFVVLLILKLESKLTSLDLVDVFIPLYAIGGIIFLSGFYLAFIIGCCLADTKNKRKYILSGAPLFCFGIIFIPLVFLISFKEGLDFGSRDISWAVVFIPLFVADGFCFCMGFFLLLFSFGSQKDALFTLPQLFIFLAIVPVSVVFKVLLILKLDNVYDISMLYVCIPMVVLEVLFMSCGITVALGNGRKKVNKYKPVKARP